MSYFLRFLSTDRDPLTAEAVEQALKDVDPRYELRQPELASATLSDLYFDGGLYAQLDLNTVEDDIVREAVDRLARELEGRQGEAAARVRGVLERTRVVVLAEVLSQHRDRAETLERIEPLWRWLFAQREGLLQTDGEGYRDAAGPVLAEG